MTKKEKEVSRMVLSGAVWGRLQGEGRGGMTKKEKGLLRWLFQGLGG